MQTAGICQSSDIPTTCGFKIFPIHSFIQEYLPNAYINEQNKIPVLVEITFK